MAKLTPALESVTLTDASGQAAPGLADLIAPAADLIGTLEGIRKILHERGAPPVDVGKFMRSIRHDDETP